MEIPMLLELAQWLARDFRGFNVFGYITLRAVLATMTALSISFIFGPAVIRWLAEKKIGQSVRSDGPQTHQPLHLDRADRHLRLRRGGLGR